MDNNIASIVIIGAGPVGLFAAFQAGLLGIQTHVIDALPHVGGQCTALYPEKEIYDIPGLPSVTGADLINKLFTQASPFSPKYYLNQKALSYYGSVAEGFTVQTSAGENIHCDFIVVSSGCGAFRHKIPDIENIEKYSTKGGGVMYSIQQKSKLSGKVVAIAGGGDSALDWAMILSNIASKVYLIHRREKFRGLEDSERKIRTLIDAGKIIPFMPYQLHSIDGKDGVLKKLTIIHRDGTLKHLDIDILLPFFGLVSDHSELSSYAFRWEDGGILVDINTMQSNLDGVYVVGDIARYPNKLKLILTGFAEAATAMHSIHALVTGNNTKHGHSSDRPDLLAYHAK